MTNISSSEAFLILGKWKENRAQLQISFAGEGKFAGTPAVIMDTSPNDETVRTSIVASGQTAEWRCSFRGASFEYGEPAESALFPEFAEGKWSSYLFVKMPDDKTVLFAERFVAEDSGDM